MDTKSAIEVNGKEIIIYILSTDDGEYVASYSNDTTLWVGGGFTQSEAVASLVQILAQSTIFNSPFIK